MDTSFLHSYHTWANHDNPPSLYNAAGGRSILLLKLTNLSSFCFSGRSVGGGSERERETEGEDQWIEAAVRTHWKAGKSHSATVGRPIGSSHWGNLWLHHQSRRRVGEKTKTKGQNSWHHTFGNPQRQKWMRNFDSKEWLENVIWYSKWNLQIPLWDLKSFLTTQQKSEWIKSVTYFPSSGLRGHERAGLLRHWSLHGEEEGGRVYFWTFWVTNFILFGHKLHPFLSQTISFLVANYMVTKYFLVNNYISPGPRRWGHRPVGDFGQGPRLFQPGSVPSLTLCSCPLPH